ELSGHLPIGVPHSTTQSSRTNPVVPGFTGRYFRWTDMPSDSRPAIAARVLAAAVVLDLALHVTTALITPYGFQRDEFLYFAMGAHLHLWSMDFPPAMAILSQLMRATTGLGLVPVRILPGVASAGLVVFAAFFARELGG